MKGYVCALNRVLNEEYPHLNTDLFRLPTLMTILDNVFREQKSKVAMSDYRNTLQ